MKKEQLNQDLEYDFPYHYIPQFRGNFSQLEVWGWSRYYTSAIEFILSEVKKDSVNYNSLFDIGCGDGRLTRELYIEFPELKVIGLDYSSKAINLAIAMNSYIEFHNIDIITFGDFGSKCDAATLIEVFEHIPLDMCDDFVVAVHNLLNEDGILYLTVPHCNIPVSEKHFQHFDLHSLENYFKEYFLIEDVKYIQKKSLFSKVIGKIMNNNFFIINNNLLNNMFYTIYKKYYFHAHEANCERIYLKLKKNRNE